MSLKPIQIKAARLYGTGVVETKVELAKSVDRSSRTIFSWFTNEEFLQKVDEFRESTEVHLTPENFLQQASDDDIKRMRELLNKDPKVVDRLDLPELRELRLRIRKAHPTYDSHFLRDLKASLRLIMGMIEYKQGNNGYDMDGNLINRERDFYVWLKRFESKIKLMRMLEETKLELDNEKREQFPQSKKGKAYKSALESIQDIKMKLEESGRLLIGLEFQ